MVLDGVADLWIEAGVQPWDLAPAQVLITEAGGVYTDLCGLESVRSSDALAGAPELHAYALQRLTLGQ
jgi:histidinol-phosphatase